MGLSRPEGFYFCHVDRLLLPVTKPVWGQLVENYAMSTQFLEIREIIRFLVLKGKSQCGIYTDVKSLYDDEARNPTSVYKWCTLTSFKLDVSNHSTHYSDLDYNPFTSLKLCMGENSFTTDEKVKEEVNKEVEKWTKGETTLSKASRLILHFTTLRRKTLISKNS